MMTIPDPRIGEFLTKNRVCCLTTLLTDGTPHASAMHFSHEAPSSLRSRFSAKADKISPLALYFSTERTGRKCEALLDGKPVGASVVVGFSEVEWVTLQMEGEVKAILDKGELEEVQRVHYAKIKEAEKYKEDPATIFLAFTPTWLRYTDYKTKPPTILSSSEI